MRSEMASGASGRALRWLGEILSMWRLQVGTGG
jgi:hypothetical protein